MKITAPKNSYKMADITLTELQALRHGAQMVAEADDQADPRTLAAAGLVEAIDAEVTEAAEAPKKKSGKK